MGKPPPTTLKFSGVAKNTAFYFSEVLFWLIACQFQPNPSQSVWHHPRPVVRAICRFWVFDGNGLLGHQLIDSRWFEKNPPTESGWKRRSKNRRSTGISRGNDRDVMSALIFALIFTPLIYIHFCVWLRTLCRSLVVEGSVTRSWFFCQTIVQ